MVIGAAVVRGGRVLAARRTAPAEARGLWEFPGGKVEPQESPRDAVVREAAEELGCVIRVTGVLPGRQQIRPGYVLEVLLAELVEGEPVPREHDAVWWLGPDQLDQVSWLGPDRPFLVEVEKRLRDEGAGTP
jgi:8-oxo-dGTP diphosphatase